MISLINVTFNVFSHRYAGHTVQVQVHLQDFQAEGGEEGRCHQRGLPRESREQPACWWTVLSQVGHLTNQPYFYSLFVENMYIVILSHLLYTGISHRKQRRRRRWKRMRRVMRVSVTQSLTISSVSTGCYVTCMNVHTVYFSPSCSQKAFLIALFRHF